MHSIGESGRWTGLRRKLCALGDVDGDERILTADEKGRVTAGLWCSRVSSSRERTCSMRRLSCRVDRREGQRQELIDCFNLRRSRSLFPPQTSNLSSIESASAKHLAPTSRRE